MQLPKDKKSRFIFSIFNTITPAWLERSVRHHQLLNSNLCWLGGAEPDIDTFFTALHIITNHTWCCWAYECIDQSETFRWVIASFWECLNSVKSFFHNVNVLCSLSVQWKCNDYSLTCNVTFTLNINSVELKICSGMTPINRPFFLLS